MNIKRHGFVTIIVAILMMSCWISTTSAKQILLGLHSNIFYDIYIGGADDSGSIIRNVQVVDIRKYEDMTFLIVRPSSFGGKGSEGIILLENIKAILPSNKFVTAPAHEKIKYH